jgi:hypothetical protein
MTAVAVSLATKGVGGYLLAYLSWHSQVTYLS